MTVMPMPEPPLGDIIHRILHKPGVGFTSLNMSRLPDGRFRATVIMGNNWPKAVASTPENALRDLERIMTK